MSARFSGRIVWITGASSGIGEATARCFLDEGARVLVSARREERLRALQRSAPEGRVAVLPFDLADPVAVEMAAQRAPDAFGEPDVLVHVGGVSQRALATDTSIDVDRRLMEVNYFGPVALTKGVLPRWLARGRGHLVGVTSLVGRIGSPLRSGYAASKHALHGFFNSLRAEVAAHGVRVTLVCPGFVATDISLNALRGDGTAQGTMDEATRRGLTPQRCALAIVDATAGEQTEVYVGGWERAGVWVERLSPALFAHALRRAKVT